MDDDNPTPSVSVYCHTAAPVVGQHDIASTNTSIGTKDKDIQHHSRNYTAYMLRGVRFISRSMTVGSFGRMGWPPLLLLLMVASLHLVTSTPLLITPTPDSIITQSIVTTSPTTTLIRNLTSSTSPTTVSSQRWLQQHTSTVLQKWKQQNSKSTLWDKHVKNEMLGVGNSLSSRGRPRQRPRPDDGTRWTPHVPTEENFEDLGPDLTNELGALINLPCTNQSADYILMLQDTPGDPLSITEFRDAETTSFSVPNLRDAEDPIEMAGLFEGDIQLSPLDHAVASMKPSNIRNAIVDLDRKWPNGVVPYVISNSYSSRHRAKIAKAMTAFSAQTCITFIPRRGHTDYIHILRGYGCSSYVGRQGGMQKVSIGPGCEFEGVIMHELMHSTGFWHEHSRQDRDHYVRILWHNIKSGEDTNFYKKLWGTEIQNLQVSYDLDSIMHYRATAFAVDKRKPTIQVLNPGAQNGEIGQRRAFSKKDLEKINKLYNCPSRPYYATQTPPTTSLPVGPCIDRNPHCEWWASQGECRSNSYWMEEYCTKSCQRCSIPVTTATTPTTSSTTTPAPPSCIDEAEHCVYWASIGECYKNSVYMRIYCLKSCRMC